MALPFHMTIKGEHQGLIEGPCEMQGREKTILCYNIKHGVRIPIQLQSGRPTGPRLHAPLTITKAYDRSSPMLYNALVTNEKLEEVEFEFYRIKGGNEEKFFEIKLIDARMIEIKNLMSTDFEKKSEVLDYMEEVSFVYRTIGWCYVDGGIESQDEWEEEIG